MHVGPRFSETITDPETGAVTTTTIKAPATALIRGNVIGDSTSVYYEASTTDPDTGVTESFTLEFGSRRDSLESNLDVAAIAAAVAESVKHLLPSP